MLQHILNLEKSTEYEARNHIRVHSKKNNNIINKRLFFKTIFRQIRDDYVFFIIYSGHFIFLFHIIRSTFNTKINLLYLVTFRMRSNVNVD